MLSNPSRRRCELCAFTVHTNTFRPQPNERLPCVDNRFRYVCVRACTLHRSSKNGSFGGVKRADQRRSSKISSCPHTLRLPSRYGRDNVSAPIRPHVVGCTTPKSLSTAYPNRGGRAPFFEQRRPKHQQFRPIRRCLSMSEGPIRDRPRFGQARARLQFHLTAKAARRVLRHAAKSGGLGRNLTEFTPELGPPISAETRSSVRSSCRASSARCRRDSGPSHDGRRRASSRHGRRYGR